MCKKRNIFSFRQKFMESSSDFYFLFIGMGVE